MLQDRDGNFGGLDLLPATESVGVVKEALEAALDQRFGQERKAKEIAELLEELQVRVV
jgi:hypothetical protein